MLPITISSATASMSFTDVSRERGVFLARKHRLVQNGWRSSQTSTFDGLRPDVGSHETYAVTKNQLPLPGCKFAAVDAFVHSGSGALPNRAGPNLRDGPSQRS